MTKKTFTTRRISLPLSAIVAADHPALVPFLNLFKNGFGNPVRVKLRASNVWQGYSLTNDSGYKCLILASETKPGEILHGGMVAPEIFAEKYFAENTPLNIDSIREIEEFKKNVDNTLFRLHFSDRFRAFRVGDAVVAFGRSTIDPVAVKKALDASNASISRNFADFLSPHRYDVHFFNANLQGAHFNEAFAAIPHGTLSEMTGSALRVLSDFISKPTVFSEAIKIKQETWNSVFGGTGTLEEFYSVCRAMSINPINVMQAVFQLSNVRLMSSAGTSVTSDTTGAGKKARLIA